MSGYEVQTVIVSWNPQQYPFAFNISRAKGLWSKKNDHDTSRRKVTVSDVFGFSMLTYSLGGYRNVNSC